MQVIIALPESAEESSLEVSEYFRLWLCLYLSLPMRFLTDTSLTEEARQQSILASCTSQKRNWSGEAVYTAPSKGITRETCNAGRGIGY